MSLDFAAFYDERWLGRHDYFAHHRERFLQTWTLVRSLQLPASGSVLDVGGVGPVADALVAQGWEAQVTTEDLRGPLGWPDARFDLVLCTETIEHIKDLESHRIADLELFNYSGMESLLRELRRLLRPDAPLVVTTPNAASWHLLSKWLHGQLMLSDPHHVREFTPEDLRDLAARCGLAQRVCRVVDSWRLGHVPMLDTVRSLIEAEPAFAGVERGDNIMAVFVRD